MNADSAHPAISEPAGCQKAGAQQFMGPAAEGCLRVLLRGHSVRNAIDLPFGESDAPEPGSFAPIGAGLLFSGISYFRKK